MRKSIKGYKLYEIDTDGNVFRIKHTRIDKLGRKTEYEEMKLKEYYCRGYLRIGLVLNGKQKFYFIHRLVAETFLVNSNCKPQVNHINGIKNDNKLSNLEWCTCSENQIHAFKIGLNISRRGEKHHNSKLTSREVLLIRLIWENKEQQEKQFGFKITQISLGKIFDVSNVSIHRIITCKRWKNE